MKIFKSHFDLTVWKVWRVRIQMLLCTHLLGFFLHALIWKSMWSVRMLCQTSCFFSCLLALLGSSFEMCSQFNCCWRKKVLRLERKPRRFTRSHWNSIKVFIYFDILSITWNEKLIHGKNESSSKQNEDVKHFQF